MVCRRPWHSSGISWMRAEMEKQRLNLTSLENSNSATICLIPVLGEDRSETKKSVLVLVLQVWCCYVKHDLVTLVVIILKDTTTFQVLFIVSLFRAWNITTVEINSGVQLLKS